MPAWMDVNRRRIAPNVSSNTGCLPSMGCILRRRSTIRIRNTLSVSVARNRELSLLKTGSNERKRTSKHQTDGKRESCRLHHDVAKHLRSTWTIATLMPACAENQASRPHNTSHRKPKESDEERFRHDQASNRTKSQHQYIVVYSISLMLQPYTHKQTRTQTHIQGIAMHISVLQCTCTVSECRTKTA